MGALCSKCVMLPRPAGIRRRMVLSSTQNVDLVKNNNFHSNQKCLMLCEFSILLIQNHLHTSIFPEDPLQLAISR